MIGKLVNYVVEFANERRSYAAVSLVNTIPATQSEGAKEEEIDLAENILSNGWARVRKQSRERGGSYELIFVSNF